MTEEMQVARPKGVAQTTVSAAATAPGLPPMQRRDAASQQAVVEPRGPGRPKIADPFDVLRQVAALLKTTDKNNRRMILETLRDLTE